MRIKTQVFMMAASLFLLLSYPLSALDNRAAESLSKGKQLYSEGRYEEAMDNFIDVFVSGNPDQISQANEYVNLIHFDRGGVVPPKQIPYDKELEQSQNRGVQGKELFGDKTPKQPKETKKTEDTAPLKEVPVKDTVEEVKEPAASEAEAAPFIKAPVVEEPVKETVKAPEESKDTKTETAVPAPVIVKTPEENLQQPEEQIQEDVIVEEETSFPKGTKAQVYALQKKQEELKRQEMIMELLGKMSGHKGVQVYMRAEHIDAIDIPTSVLFKGSTSAFNNNTNGLLDDIYALMILENAPSYYILPEGSYTDDVTLQGVRQAVTLNSYLINRGISPAKMNLNMGLTTQEPPEKFSNLAGISIVFDYEGKPRLKSKLQEKNLPPVLSLAVYPFKEIVPALGEVFVMDFSVTEGTAPVKSWILQIINHSTDGHYYVVKQLSGENALVHQVFWNGHKRYFGQLLPAGKYTIVLKATDKEGRERILKRQIMLKEGPKKLDALVKTEAEVAKEEKVKQNKEANKKENKLDYNQKRLWNKPSAKRMGGVFEENNSTVAVHEPIAQTKGATIEGLTDVPQDVAVNNSSNPYEVEGNSYETTVNPYEEATNPYAEDASGNSSYGF